MSGSMKSAPSTAEIVVEILELLDAHTDREHGVSAVWISKQLGVTEKTVRGHLHTLAAIEPFGRKVGKLERKDLINAQSIDPKTGWYIEPIFDTAQMRLLADGAALSRSDGEYLRDLIAKVYAFAGRSGQLDGLGTLLTPPHYNREFLSNVEQLNDAIAHERQIHFHYCTYDINGELIPRIDAAGKPKEYTADPYNLRYKNEKYYLICHLQSYDDLSYLHVERIRNLRVEDANHSVQRTFDSFTDDAGNPIDITAFMSERPYPIDGEAIPIRLRVEGGLEPVFDWFNDAKVTQIEENVYDVTIKAPQWATVFWALQYTNSGVHITVLEPESLRSELLRAGHTLLNRYGTSER